jgi:ATP-dependent DNA ligase
MLLQRTDSLPDSPQWLYELKLDGYRAIAFKATESCICVRATTTTSAAGTRAW